MTTPEEMTPLGFWRRLDQKIYRVECILVGAATAVMSVMVFLQVVCRSFNTQQGKIEIALRGWLEAPDAGWVHTLADSINFLLWLGLCIFGAHTARKSWSWAKALAVGSACAVGSVLFGLVLTWIFPHGIVFSQRIALSLMMWIVLLGSSMAAYTRRHLLLQAAQKLVPERLLPTHAALGLIAAAIFTFFLLYVGAIYAWRNLSTWVESEMTTGIWESIPIPYWAVTIAVPIGFGLTMARFLGQAVGIWKGTIPAVPPPEELAAAEEQALGDEA